MLEEWYSLTKPIREKRLKEQKKIEDSLLAGGIEKYWKEWERAKDEGKPEQKLIQSAVEHLSGFYQKWIDSCVQNKKSPTWLTHLLTIGADKMADISIRCVIRVFLTKQTLNSSQNSDSVPVNAPVAQQIAKLIADDICNIVAFRATKKTHYVDWKKQSKFIKNWTPKRCNAFVKKMGSIARLTAKQKEDLGHNMLRIAMSSDILESRIHYTANKKKVLLVSFAPWILKTLSDQHHFLESMSMVYRPMICPPIPHTKETDGGFLDETLRKRLIKRYLSNTSVAKCKPERPSSIVLTGLNAMMNTEWSVNKPVYKVLKTCDYYVDKYSQNPLIKIIQDSLNLYISIIAMDRNKSCHLPTRQDNKYYYMFLYLLNNNYTIFSNNHLSKIHTLYKVLPKSIYTFTEFNSQIQTGEIPSLLLILYLYVHCDNTSIYPFSLLKSEIDKLDYTQKQLIKKEAEKLKNYKPSAASASAYSQQNYGQSASINRTNFCYYVTLRLDLYEGYELPLMNCDMKQQNILTEFTDLTGYTIPSEIKILGQHIPTGVPGPIDENKWLDMLNTNKPDKNKPATPTMFNQVTNLFKQAGQLINPNAAATATAALATTNALTAARPAAARPAPARPKLKGGINTRKKHSPTTKKIIFTKFKMPHATRRHHNITHKHMN